MPFSQHAVTGFTPWAKPSGAVRKFMEGLSEVFGTSMSPVDSTRLTTLDGHRCDPTERCQAVRIFPSVTLQPESTEQSRGQSGASATQTCEQVCVGMSIHSFFDFAFEFVDGYRFLTVSRAAFVIP